MRRVAARSGGMRVRDLFSRHLRPHRRNSGISPLSILRSPPWPTPPAPARSPTVSTRLARLLQGRIKDPRLGFVTVTDVRVTGDLQQATIFYTVYGSDEDRRDSAAALNSAKGLIRSEVGRALGIRLTPSLTFQLDALPTQAKSFDDALARARAKDEEIARAHAGASYAGEEDPYRHDDEPDDEADDGTDFDAAGADEAEA